MPRHPLLRLPARTLSTSASVTWERATPGRPRAVPPRADAITAEWLSRVLGEPVTHVTAPQEDVGTSTRAALTATLADGRTLDLFTKLTSSLTQRMLLGLIDCLAGEPGFFARIRPLVDFECPHGYHAAYDSRSWRSVVVMEDIAVTRGATFHDPITPLTRAEIESVLTAMATLHGTLWEHPAVGGWLKTPADHIRNCQSFISMKGRCAVGARRAADVIPPAVHRRSAALFDALDDSVRFLSTEQPVTFLHGDPHIGNTYRTDAGVMGLTDWQICMRGGWGWDVAYTVTTALAVEDRRAWERDLLALYLDRLAAAGGRAPAPDEAFEVYRRSLLYPYHAMTFTIGRSALQPKMQPDAVCRAAIERTAAAIDDLDPLGAF